MPTPADIVINESYETYPDPVLLTNGDGIIVAANPAATTALGYAQRELLGMNQAELGISRSDTLGPAEKLSASEDKNRWFRGKASLHGKDGRALSVEISRRLLSDNDTPSTGALMIIRELETPSGGLAEQLGSDQFLKSALDSVSYGFAIFDQADRLVLCNNAYRDMHAAFTPVIQPGKTFEEMLREAIETDQFPEAGSTPELREAWIEQRLAKHNNPVAPFVLQVNPNKWIQVEDRVTADNYRVGMRADVTALMRAKSEAERLGFILDGVAQEVYLVNPKNRSIIYANKSARDNLQYSMDELRSLDARRLNADFSPDELTERMKPLLSGKAKVLSLDTRHRRKDGTIYVCRVRIERMEEAPETVFLSFGEDITERLEIEAALERKQSEFETLVRSLPDIISRAAPDTTLTYVNENYARFNGCKPEDLIGCKFLDFVPPDVRPEVLQKISGLTPERPMKTMERQMRDHAGQLHWYSWTNLMVFEDGMPRELVSVGRDITESYQARERIARQKLELAARNDALEQFAGIVSHDLKAPLRQIRLFSDMIAEDLRSGKTDELEVFSSHISDRGRAMEQMVSSLLEYSQLAYLSTNPTTFKLSEAVAVAWSNLAINAIEAEARLTNEVDAEILADKNLMIQLLQNLFANSMKYRTADTPVEVRVDVQTQDTVVSIAVTDNGIGIDPKQAENIFGVFKRLHRDEQQYPGSGLGLALCRRIAESHGGKIVLDASVPRGARFVITLPRAGL